MKAPNPMGCARCGIDQRGHAIQTGTGGSHTWEQPTRQQIKERMHARRAGREASVTDEPDGELTCSASQYPLSPGTYDGRSLCGCLNCREYVADQEGEFGS